MPQDGPDRSTPLSVCFAGDLEDPWVAAIADALSIARPRSATALSVRRVNFPGDLPDSLFDVGRTLDVLVLHRAVLTRRDAERLARWRSCRTPPARVVLCFGPHVRHADLERWATLVDATVPEATARESIARHVEPSDAPHGLGVANHGPSRATGPRSRVAVVSTNSALRGLLAEAVEALGYVAAPARDWEDAAPDALAVWDVPVLEPSWPDALARRARLGPVVVLLGFADRTLVNQARARGASACLELPFDLADLAATLDRLTAAPATSSTWNEPPHPTPPPPVSRRRETAPNARRVVEPGRET